MRSLNTEKKIILRINQIPFGFAHRFDGGSMITEPGADFTMVGVRTYKRRAEERKGFYIYIYIYYLFFFGNLILSKSCIWICNSACLRNIEKDFLCNSLLLVTLDCYGSREHSVRSRSCLIVLLPRQIHIRKIRQANANS